MRILVYGFGPYKDHGANISERVVRRIRARKNLVRAVFPVEFKRRIFIDRIRASCPDIILGLGMHPRSRRIRIERKAANLKSRDRREEPVKILKNKPEFLFVNKRLRKDDNSWISYNAGKYVCNYSMYVISDFSRNRDIRFAFIHIPKDYNLDKAVEFAETKINEML